MDWDGLVIVEDDFLLRRRSNNKQGVKPFYICARPPSKGGAEWRGVICDTIIWI
jgi:hypothetical protein